MKKDISIKEFEYVLGMMKSVQDEHPKASVVFDTERMSVVINYPLPKDMWQITQIGLNHLKKL